MTKNSMGTLTNEGRNNPHTHWVGTLTIVVVKLTHGNSVNKHIYKQQHNYMYAHIPTHIRFSYNLYK